MRFQSTVELGGKTATGISVPDEIVAALDSGKRPAVRVTVAGHSYRTTIASMDGRFFVPLNADNRSAAGVEAGDPVVVEINVDDSPREVTVPEDLSEALETDSGARAYFEGLSYTHQKEWVEWIEGAKRAGTRSSRVAKTVASLHERQPSR